MGALYRFACEGCGYEAIVSGGRDAGELSETETMACATCRELVDVVVRKVAPERARIARSVGCPYAKSTRGVHVLTRWNPGDPCPRCRGEITRQEMAAVWD